MECPLPPYFIEILVIAVFRTKEQAVNLLHTGTHTHIQLGVSCPAMCHVYNESPPITDGEKNSARALIFSSGPML